MVLWEKIKIKTPSKGSLNVSTGRAFKPQLEPNARRLWEIEDKAIDLTIKDLRVYLIGRDADVNFLKKQVTEVIQSELLS